MRAANEVVDARGPIAGERVLVAMSGGVDSSVAAAVLVEAGCDVVGVTMKLHGDGSDVPDRPCCSLDSTSDARRVCEKLGIPHYVTNLVDHFGHDVLADFVAEYARGRTPIPCVRCNTFTKFRDLLAKADAVEAAWMATGHYARMGTRDGVRVLRRGLDDAKDQSYFLHRLNQAQLSRTLFPLGEIPKTEVRRIALEIGLPNATKKDSTGICFIGERPFRAFLNQYLPTQPGPIVTQKGKKIGTHHGLSFYTLGQRKGLGIGGVKGHQQADGTGPVWYVARKDIPSNTLYVVEGHEHPWLLSDQLRAGQLSWVAGHSPAAGAYAAKTRYRQSDADCVLTHATPEGFMLSFSEAQWAVTPGQSAVLYDGDICLGGGIIT